MHEAPPPEVVLEAAGLRPHELTPLAGARRIWLFETGGGRGVLKARRHTEASVAWEANLLHRLAERFPVPLPVDRFERSSWFPFGGEMWTTQSHLPGEALGWRADPPIGALGVFLARYHAAVDGIAAGARPGTEPVDELVAGVTESDGAAALGGEEPVRRFMELRAGLAPPSTAELVIHGDFTVDNVIVSGSPARLSGVVDFGMAQLGPRVADLAWSVWRSARPHRDAIELDLERVRALVTGYRNGSSAQVNGAELVDWLVRRGLMFVALGDPPRAGTALTRAAWIDEHRAELVAAAS